MNTQNKTILGEDNNKVESSNYNWEKKQTLKDNQIALLSISAGWIIIHASLYKVNFQPLNKHSLWFGKRFHGTTKQN